MEVEENEIKYKYIKVTFYIIMIYTTLYHTYQLLYCTGHLQMTNNYKRIDVKKKTTE